MTSWEALNVFRDILITYYFGSPLMYYGSLVLFFILALSIAGLEFRMALIFALPLLGAFSVAGVFGGSSWIVNVAMLIVGVIYAYILMELFT